MFRHFACVPPSSRTADLRLCATKIRSAKQASAKNWQIGKKSVPALLSVLLELFQGSHEGGQNGKKLLSFACSLGICPTKTDSRSPAIANQSQTIEITTKRDSHSATTGPGKTSPVVMINYPRKGRPCVLVGRRYLGGPEHAYALAHHPSVRFYV